MTTRIALILLALLTPLQLLAADSSPGSAAKQAAKVSADLAPQGTVWFDGDRRRTFWLSLSELAVHGDPQLVRSRQAMADVSREAFPDAEVLDADERMSRVRLPRAGSTKQAMERQRATRLPAGARRTGAVFYGVTDASGDPHVLTGQMVVHFRAPRSEQEATAWAAERGITLVEKLRLGNAFVFTCDEGTACLAQASRIYAEPDVRYAYPNWVRPRHLKAEKATADVSVTKTDSADPVAVGQDLTYVVTVTNHGPESAQRLRMTDTLPAGVDLVSVTSSQGSCVLGTTISCRLYTLANGAVATVTIVVRPTAAGDIVNTAVVSTGRSTDPNPANDTATQTTTVTGGGAPSADLSISKSDNPDPVTVGENLTYSVVVTNNGPDTATGVTVSDTLPAGVSFVSASVSPSGSCSGTSTVSCNLPDLANGASATVTIVVQPTSAGAINNSASVASATTDPNSANNTVNEATTVEDVAPSGADLSITKSDSPDPVTVGENLTYSVVVTNNGPDTATGVTVSDTLPAGVTFVSASVSPSGSCSGTSTLSCNLPDLADSASATVTIVVQPGTAGLISNTASVSASTDDPNASNDSATEDTTVQDAGAGPNDPLYPDQWHLNNTGQGGGTAGEDVNAPGAWDTVSGSADEVIAIVDDGLEIAHEDLAGNVVAGLSWDYVGDDGDPTGGDHGTSVAGVAAAVGDNGIGVSGVAPGAGLVGFRLPSFSSDVDESSALSRSYNTVDIYSNSWGPFDDGRRLEGPGPLTEAAFADAVANGRGGLGNVYCWAGGNGGNGDNSNYDGFANSRYTIAVAASTNLGIRSSYSEPGANLLVNTPSSGGTVDITTTDRTGGTGYAPGNYTDDFGGTSSSTPLACGIVALMLDANQALGWRDVQYILATTAEKNDPTHSDWTNNAAGHPVNHFYGFGRADAAAAVSTAVGWTNLGPEQSTTGTANPNTAIPDNNATGVSSTINIGDDLSIEWVEVIFDASDHSYWGDLEIVLTSPSGTESVLAEEHVSGRNTAFYDDWPLRSVRHLDESSLGDWTLTVRDRAAQDTGTFQSWTLNIYGTSGTPLPPRADLALSKSDDPDPATVGENLTYTMVVTNNGPDTATGVTLTDNLPAGVNFVSASVSPSGSCSGTSTVNCNLPDLADTASAIVTIVVQPTAAGNLNNSASVSAATDDSNTANNSANEDTTVVDATVPSADLALTKSDSSDPATVGENLTYTMLVTNNGPDTATGVTLSDSLPAGVNFVSASVSPSGSCSGTSTVDCNLPDLANGASATVTIIVQPTSSGSLSNSASVSSSIDDPNTANNSANEGTTVVDAPPPSADLAITKSDSPDPVLVDGNLTYTVTVANNGPDTATGVSVTDNLPAGVNFVSATVSPSGSCSGTSTVNCNLPDLANGASATVTIVVQPTAAGNLNNSASVSASTDDPNGNNDSANEGTTVNEPSGTTHVLNVRTRGEGTVTSDPTGIACPGDCSETYGEGTAVTLTAEPAAGWRFRRWAGACSGTALTCDVDMNSNLAVGAVFLRQ